MDSIQGTLLASLRQPWPLFAAVLVIGGCGRAHSRDPIDAGRAPDGGHSSVDGGHSTPDGGVVRDTSPPPDACVPLDEMCDGRDDDCDGRVDDDAICTFAHAAGSCVDATCLLSTCDAGFANCNGDPTDGCEIEIATDRQNCGACSVSCGVTESCFDGTCEREQIVDVALGGRFGCVLLASRRVLCWGTNESGALTDEYPVGGSPVPVELHAAPAEIVDLAAGDSAMYARTADGTLWAWGWNFLGEIGIGRTSLEPQPPSRVLIAEPVVAIDSAHSGESACATTSSGAVLCWGQLIDHGEPTPTVVPGITSPIFVTGQHVSGWLAMTSAGTFSWGDDRYGLNGARTPTGLYTAPAPINLGGSPLTADCGCHCCAILAGGAISCWGSDYLGALGDGSPHDTTWEPEGGRYSDPVVVAAPAGAVEVAVMGSPLHDIAACARYADGRVWCWGGPLANGLGHTAPSPEELALPPGGASAIFGGRSGCALLEDRTRLRCWGANWFGELGDGSVDRPALTPVPVVGFE